MKKLIVALVTMLSLPVYASECVVLLHGLARTSGSMERMQAELQSHGYEVVNIGYASRAATIQELSEPAIEESLEHCHAGATVHFVTHSMGGIIVRYYLAQREIENLGKVVMLGPPNQGSEVVDRLAGVPGFGLIHGPAGEQLGTGPESLPKSIGAANFDVGVISGTRTSNPVLSLYLPNPDDGKVSVASTQLDGMNDHISMPVTHTFMMRNARVIGQVVHYLRHGHFQRENES